MALVEWVGVGQAQTTGAVSLIVPTRNEAGNVIELLARLHSLPLGLLREVIFVDDSDDDTVEVIERAAPAFSVPVTLVHREPGQRTGGLSGAVVAGFRQARGDWLAVMDADLQHPPEVLAELYGTAADRKVDIVCATRNVAGGDRAGLSGIRDLISRSFTGLARVAFPRRLHGVSDPMSGFFLVRRNAVVLEDLRPAGFKILLEILVRTGGLRRAEVPFEFADRFAGDSKASLREGVTYLRHVARLRLAA